MLFRSIIQRLPGRASQVDQLASPRGPGCPCIFEPSGTNRWTACGKSPWSQPTFLIVYLRVPSLAPLQPIQATLLASTFSSWCVASLPNLVQIIVIPGYHRPLLASPQAMTRSSISSNASAASSLDCIFIQKRSRSLLRWHM